MMAGLVTAALWLALGAPGRANAFEAEQAFAQGTKILGLQANGGVQNNIQDEPETSGLDFIGVQPRFSYLPFQPFGSSWYAAAIEPGVEGWVQYYMHPQTAVAGGLKASLRLHAIGLGPVIPYLEGTAGVGGTSLDVRESRSRFTFIFEGGRRLGLRGARGGPQRGLSPPARLERQYVASQPRLQRAYGRRRRVLLLPLIAEKGGDPGVPRVRTR